MHIHYKGSGFACGQENLMFSKATNFMLSNLVMICPVEFYFEFLLGSLFALSLFASMDARIWRP